MSERVMIGSRADVERHIDDIIGRLPGHEHRRERVVRELQVLGSDGRDVRHVLPAAVAHRAG